MQVSRSCLPVNLSYGCLPDNVRQYFFCAGILAAASLAHVFKRVVVCEKDDLKTVTSNRSSSETHVELIQACGWLCTSLFSP